MVAVSDKNKRRFPYLLLIGVLVCLWGCEGGVKKRPFGAFRLGNSNELSAPETDLNQYGLVLRRDEGGWFVMSTYCTYDLSHLKRVQTKDGFVYVSDYNESRYAADGTVLNGPAKAPLPYYKLRLEPGEYGGPKDTLYVEVGQEVGREWRLKE